MRELTCSLDGFSIVLWSAHHNTAWMQIVIQRMSFTQEFGREEDAIVIEGFAQLLRVSNGNRRFDDNPSAWRILAD